MDDQSGGKRGELVYIRSASAKEKEKERTTTMTTTMEEEKEKWSQQRQSLSSSPTEPAADAPAKLEESRAKLGMERLLGPAVGNLI